ncbi:integral membrane protein MviN [Serratia plymuthica]|uniref:Integral membrane protein MviN n=1 Tax=Serratia plymuthica TaxID=82996 RepID=A0A2X4UQ99_SERPL|nr:integral membrane protein MviN [Serratia plymuthica]
MRKQKIFHPQPGWATFLTKLVIAVIVMSVVLVGVMWLMPAWDQGNMLERLLRLAVVVVAGVIAYFGVLAGLGFRPRDFARRVA